MIIKVRLNKMFKFRKEDKKDLSENNTVVIKKVGNITESSDYYFEFDIRGEDEINQQFLNINRRLLKRSELPIQGNK